MPILVVNIDAFILSSVVLMFCRNDQIFCLIRRNIIHIHGDNIYLFMITLPKSNRIHSERQPLEGLVAGDFVAIFPTPDDDDDDDDVILFDAFCFAFLNCVPKKGK